MERFVINANIVDVEADALVYSTISVDGTNVVSMSLTQSISIVRGPVGSFVILEIADSKLSRTNKFTVKRSKMVFSRENIEFIDQQ